jgi:DNA polymerase-3 subunit gamma/tau
MDLTEDAAALLARLSDGALRDALSLLDQCAAQGGTIDSQRVLDVLGLAGNVQTAQLMEYLLSRDVQGALMQANDLYAAGKDVGALLGELSTLTRDLLIRMTAPQAGQALLSGGYDEATMERLSQGVTATRLIYMATQLQSAAAALPMSVKARTDAELCLIRLCDESLCGDTTALAARLSRLEEGGAAAPAAVPRPAPVPRAAPMPEQKPVTKPPKPAVKAPDPPPWEEEAPPPFSDDDAPPPYGEPVAAKPVMESPAQPSQPPQSAPKPGGSQVWQTLIERYKERLGPLYWFTLDDAIGVLEDDRLVVYCGEQVTKDTLEERPEAAQVLQTVTSEHLGRPVSVTFRVGKAPLAEGESAPDPLDQLIRRGQKFENFHVK